MWYALYGTQIQMIFILSLLMAIIMYLCLYFGIQFVCVVITQAGYPERSERLEHWNEKIRYCFQDLLFERQLAERYRSWIMAQLGQHKARNITEAIMDAVEPRSVQNAYDDSDLEMTTFSSTKFSKRLSQDCQFRDQDTLGMVNLETSKLGYAVIDSQDACVI